jgi:predicted nucleic acid-binding protein
VVLAASAEAGVPVVVPAIVLAETLFGDARDARVNQVLKKLQVLAITEEISRSAAVLKRLAGKSGVSATVDALVVAVSAALGGGVVLTSDVDDITLLAQGASVRVRALQV